MSDRLEHELLHRGTYAVGDSTSLRADDRSCSGARLSLMSLSREVTEASPVVGVLEGIRRHDVEAAVGAMLMRPRPCRRDFTVPSERKFNNNL